MNKVIEEAERKLSSCPSREDYTSDHEDEMFELKDTVPKLIAEVKRLENQQEVVNAKVHELDEAAKKLKKENEEAVDVIQGYMQDVIKYEKVVAAAKEMRKVSAECAIAEAIELHNSRIEQFDKALEELDG